MRVQAKRVQSDGILKIKHKIRSSGLLQRNRLMDDAIANNMEPVYCIYCAASHRSIWNPSHLTHGRTGFQFGCLLAKAQNVPETTRTLESIERYCRPWHYLLLPPGFFICNQVSISLYSDNVSLHEISLFSLERDQDDHADEQLDVWDFPSISHLNGGHECRWGGSLTLPVSNT